MRPPHRFARRFALGVLSAVPLVLASAGAAGAAGAGGIEITPLVDSGRAATAFHVKVQGGRPAHITFEVRNVGGSPAAARVYAAAVSRTASAYAVAGPGSAPWIRLAPDTVRLAPGERRRYRVDVSAGHAPRGDVVYGAVVEEPVEDSAVVRRVATLVYLDRTSPPAATRPVALLAVATVLLATAGSLLVRRARRT